MFTHLNRKAKFQPRVQQQFKSEADIVAELTDHELISLTQGSSYYRKQRPTVDLSQLARPQLEELYTKARSYACHSIVNSLYHLDRLQPEVNHLHCRRSKFRILARVRTNWEAETMEETAAQREFLSFSILEDQNLSHFPGLVIYGYYSHITPEMIGFINHIDADTHADAAHRLALSEHPEELLDIDDLLPKTRAEQTYCQISLRSKYPATINGQTVQATLLPDCIICIGKIDRRSQDVAHQTELPILLIHPDKHTLCRVHDQFETTELAHPYRI